MQVLLHGCSYHHASLLHFSSAGRPGCFGGWHNVCFFATNGHDLVHSETIAVLQHLLLHMQCVLVRMRTGLCGQHVGLNLAKKAAADKTLPADKHDTVQTDSSTCLLSL